MWVFGFDQMGSAVFRDNKSSPCVYLMHEIIFFHLLANRRSEVYGRSVVY